MSDVHSVGNCPFCWHSVFAWNQLLRDNRDLKSDISYRYTKINFFENLTNSKIVKFPHCVVVRNYVNGLIASSTICVLVMVNIKVLRWTFPWVSATQCENCGNLLLPFGLFPQKLCEIKVCFTGLQCTLFTRNFCFLKVRVNFSYFHIVLYICTSFKWLCS